MKLNIALLAGDGIGPEVINQAVKVSNAIAKKFNHQITWTSALTGAAAIDARRGTADRTDAGSQQADRQRLSLNGKIRNSGLGLIHRQLASGGRTGATAAPT